MTRPLLALMLVLVLSAPAEGGDKLDLETLTGLALETNPLVDAARASMGEFEAKYRQASLSFLPVGKVEAFGSATPKKSGNALAGETDMEEWGPFAGVKANAAIPLYTFGKLSTLKEMAAAGIEVGRAQVEMARAELRYQVQRAYFSLLTAREARALISDGEGYLEKARTRLEELEEQDSDDYDQVDMLRLKVYEAEIAGMKLKADRAARLSATALSLLTGVPEADLEIAGELQPLSFRDLSQEDLLSLASGHRPELLALDAAGRASQAGISLEKRKWAPNLFLFGTFSLAKAWAVEGQGSPFAYDPFNSWFGGGGLGMQWELDVGARLAGVDEASARYRKYEAQYRTVLLQTRMELAQKLGEVLDCRELMVLNRKAHKAARGWVMAKTDLYDSGVVELKDVIEGLTVYFKNKLAWQEAVLDFNLAVAGLAKACGVPLEELTEPK